MDCGILKTPRPVAEKRKALSEGVSISKRSMRLRT